MKLQFEVLGDYTFKRELKVLSDVFTFTCSTMTPEKFNQSALHFLHSVDVRDRNPTQYLSQFYRFLRDSTRLMQSPLTQEIIRLDWLKYKRNENPAMMMTHYPLDVIFNSTSRKSGGVNFSKVPKKQKRRQREPFYFLINGSNYQHKITRLSKIEFQLTNWILRNNSAEVIKRKIQLLNWVPEKVSTALAHLKNLDIVIPD